MEMTEVSLLDRLNSPAMYGIVALAIALVVAMMRTTCAFTTAKDSDGLNVLPTAASVTANLRFIHHQANEESLALLEKRAKKYDVEMEVITQDSPVRSSITARRRLGCWKRCRRRSIRATAWRPM